MQTRTPIDDYFSVLDKTPQKLLSILKLNKKATAYQVLSIGSNADEKAIKAGYRQTMMRYHPDKYKGNEQDASEITKLVSAAYLIFSNEKIKK